MKLRRRPSLVERQRALEGYLAELMKLDWKSMTASAPTEPGRWPIEGLPTRRDPVHISASYFVPYDEGDMCVIADASGSGPIRRVVVDGFALRTGCTPEQMTDAEWAALNI